MDYFGPQLFNTFINGLADDPCPLLGQIADEVKICDVANDVVIVIVQGKLPG